MLVGIEMRQVCRLKWHRLDWILIFLRLIGSVFVVCCLIEGDSEGVSIAIALVIFHTREALFNLAASGRGSVGILQVDNAWGITHDIFRLRLMIDAYHSQAFICALVIIVAERWEIFTLDPQIIID